MVEMQDSLQFDNEKDFKKGLGAGKGINGTLESRSPPKGGSLKGNDHDDGYERTSSGAHIAKLAEQSVSKNAGAQSSAAYMMETAATG